MFSVNLCEAGPMLGSYFDLSSEVAAIAARREKEMAHDRLPSDRAYADFDRRVHEFVRALTPEGQPVIKVASGADSETCK